MINVDVVMLAYCKDAHILEMTQNALTSLRESEDKSLIRFNIIVVETQEVVNHAGCTTVHPGGEFNYNRYLNAGFKYLTEGSDYVTVVNNDVLFHSGWFSALMNNLKGGWDSACSVNPGWPPHAGLNGWNQEGFGIGSEFTGWIQTFRRLSLDKLIPFNEDIQFWCSDNWLAWKMQMLDMENVLCGTSKVTHFTSQSHRLIPNGKHHEWTHGQGEIFARIIAEG